LLARGDTGGAQILGEAAVQADGSFLVDVPSNRALGFETVDAHGQVIHRLPPLLWLRPGENRACVGCHEPHNQSPENIRPLAVKLPPVPIGLNSEIVALNPAP
jgi:hypothetical protein